MAYITITEIYNLTDFDDDDISNTQFDGLIKRATKLVNKDINVDVRLWDVEYIDDYRQNKLDGSNTTFYIPQSWSWYFGDRNNSGTITIDDVEAWEYKSDSTREQLTVSTIDEKGKIVVSTAPAATSTALKLNYVYSPVSENGLSCDMLIKLATAYMTASLASLKLEARDNWSVNLDRLKLKNTPKAYYTYKEQYYDVLERINYRARRIFQSEDMTSERALSLLY